MFVSFQASSAERGFLLRQHDDRIWVEASGSLEDIQVEPSIALEDCSEISHSIVRYAARALETVVTGDSSRDERFDADSSLPRERPLSVLCTPILHQDRATAIIYLENNQTRDAFVEERLSAIRVISSQAAELLPGLLAVGARPTGLLELEGRRRRGGKFPAEVNLSHLETDAGELLCCTIRDISDRKRAESELRRALSEVAKLKERLEAENVYFREEIRGSHDFRELVGESKALRRVLTKVEQVAATDASVLILGETGTGKELVARAIHARSRRGDKALVKVNCAALPGTLICQRRYSGSIPGTGPPAGGARAHTTRPARLWMEDQGAQQCSGSVGRDAEYASKQAQEARPEPPPVVTGLAIAAAIGGSEIVSS